MRITPFLVLVLLISVSGCDPINIQNGGTINTEVSEIGKYDLVILKNTGILTKKLDSSLIINAIDNEYITWINRSFTVSVDDLKDKIEIPIYYQARKQGRIKTIIRLSDNKGFNKDHLIDVKVDSPKIKINLAEGFNTNVKLGRSEVRMLILESRDNKYFGDNFKLKITSNRPDKINLKLKLEGHPKESEGRELIIPLLIDSVRKDIEFIVSSSDIDGFEFRLNITLLYAKDKNNYIVMGEPLVIDMRAKE